MASSGETTQFQRLLDKASAGDPAVYDDLLALASERLLKLTRKMLRNYPRLRRWEQTDDVFQNAALRLHRSLTKVQPRSVREFFGLATTQIRRTLIDLARHHFGPAGQAANQQSDFGANESGIPAAENKSHADDPPENLEAWSRFHEAVELLPELEREVFQLLWYGALEQKQVANLLDISVPTVQRRWYRARHLLSTALSGHQPPVDE